MRRLKKSFNLGLKKTRDCTPMVLRYLKKVKGQSVSGVGVVCLLLVTRRSLGKMGCRQAFGSWQGALWRRCDSVSFLFWRDLLSPKLGPRAPSPLQLAGCPHCLVFSALAPGIQCGWLLAPCVAPVPCSGPCRAPGF